MSNVICHICEINLALKKYDGKLSDEEGNKPCLDCVLESDELDGLSEDGEEAEQ